MTYATLSTADLPAAETLLRAAFPSEDLVPLVRALLEPPASAFALVAPGAAGLDGIVLFTRCAVEGGGSAALLGPLAVATPARRRGLGAGLVRAGLARAEAEGAGIALVLGDPDYYSRFGFAAPAPVAPPYPLPSAWAEAWRGLPLGPGPAPAGRLRPPAPWLRPELWAP